MDQHKAAYYSKIPRQKGVEWHLQQFAIFPD